MVKLLDRGFNFSILSYKLDITQVEVDFKRLERSLVWKEFWYGRDKQDTHREKIFQTKNNNLPKNYTVPEGLENIYKLSSI